MEKSVCIILGKAPYGTIDAAEAVRHSLGGVVEEMDVNFVLVNAGVHAARKNQDTSGTEYDSIGSGIVDCLDMEAKVYADKTSLDNEKLDESDLIDGVAVVDISEIAGIIKEAHKTLIF